MVREVLDRIAERGEDHVWISRVPDDELLRRAGELEARLAGRSTDAPAGRATAETSTDDVFAALPLFGVPFAVKDNIDVAGMPTTAACPDFAYLAASSATAVQRLVEAGAVLVGKTNLDQFATGLVGTRSPYGACQSVFGGGLVSGGSSSGSAVCVAAGEVAFALGTDTAGSGRVPAALNGIVGLKPTRGLVSTAGVVPACRSLDCVSVFATTIADAGAVLRVVAGPDDADAWSRRPPHACEPVALQSMRLGYGRLGRSDFSADDDQWACYRQAVDRAGRLAGAVLGAVVAVNVEPLVEAGSLLYTGPWVAERLAGLESFVDSHPDSLLPVTRGILAGGRAVTGTDAFRGMHRLRTLQATVEMLWQRVDAVLLPTVPTTATFEQVAADPLGRNALLGRFTQSTNLLDLAALAVPNGRTPDGRPAGMMLVGPAFSEERLMALAGALLADERPPAARGERRGRHVGGPGRGPSSGPTASGGTAGRTPARIAPASQTTDGTSSDDGSTVNARVLLAVVGRHLSGQPANGELVRRGGRLVEVTTTAPDYRLFELRLTEHAVPGLLRTGGGGSAIETEVWSLPSAGLGDLLPTVPRPLGIGWVELRDGRHVLGFVCQQHSLAGARDITGSGGWREHLASSTGDQQHTSKTQPLTSLLEVT